MLWRILVRGYIPIVLYCSVPTSIIFLNSLICKYMYVDIFFAHAHLKLRKQTEEAEHPYRKRIHQLPKDIIGKINEYMPDQN